MTDAQALELGIARCSSAECAQWVHQSRMAQHTRNRRHATTPQPESPPPSPDVERKYDSQQESPDNWKPPKPPVAAAGTETEPEAERKDPEPGVYVRAAQLQSTEPESDNKDSGPFIHLLPTSYSSWPHLFTSIPHIAQSEWTILCTTKLKQIYDAHMHIIDTDEATATRDNFILELLALPRLALQRASGEGHSQRKLRLRLFRHHQQEQQNLQPTTAPAAAAVEASKDPRDDKARRISTAVRKVLEGHVGKAVNALLQPGNLEVTVAVLEQLQALHPDASAPLPAAIVDEAVKKWLTGNDISRKSDRFYDNGSSPGPSGWTGAMLRPLLHNETCRRGLALIFSLIMNGDIHTPRLRGTLRAARLIPGSKAPASGVRPIAVGELFARVGSVFALSSVLMSEVFNDGIQLGLGVSSGVERAILTAQSLLDKHTTVPDTILISTDIKNAFNTCSRSSIMTALDDNPETRHLCALFQWSHGGTSALLVYKDRKMIGVIDSSEGVQQGHPLGSLGFDLSIHPDYVHVQAKVADKGVRLIAIHDDLSIIGPAPAAWEAYKEFQQRLLLRGDLVLRPDKCRVLIPTSDPIHIQTISQQAESHGVSIVLGAMSLHGGCVGSDEGIMRDTIAKTVSSLEHLLELVSDTRMPSQIAWHIIRQCVVSRVGFHARVTQPAIARDAFKQFDRNLIKTISESHSLPPGLDTDQDRKLLLASLGIAPSVRISPIAYMSCLLSCLPFLPHLDPSSSTYVALASAHHDLASPASILDVSSRIPLSLSATVRQYRNPDIVTSQLQRFVTSALKKSDRLNLSHRHDTMAKVLKTILHSTDSKHSNLLFRFLPTHPDLVLKSDDWDQLVRARLALPPSDNIPSRCPHCRAELPTLLAKTHHHHSCVPMMKLRTDRHNGVLNVTLRLARQAGYTTNTHQLWDHIPMEPELRLLKPDATIVPGAARRRSIMLDMGVTHPCAPTHLERASTQPLSAAKVMLQDKHNKYRELAGIVSYDFVGTIMETYGGMVDEFRRLIESLVEQAARNEQLSLAHAKQLQIHTFAALSAALHRGNAAQARLMFQLPSVEDRQAQPFHMQHHAPVRGGA